MAEESGCDPSKFRSTLCNKTRSLTTSGQSYLSIHTSGDNHKEIVKKDIASLTRVRKN